MNNIMKRSHNALELVYHIVCPIKYRRDVITDKVKYMIFRTCQSLSKTHDLYFIEVGTDGNHGHFLVQSVSTYSPTQIVTIIKSNIGRAVFKYNPEVKRYLWGGELWTDGYFVATVSTKSTLDVIADYVKNRGNNEYEPVLVDTVFVRPNSSL